MIEKVYRMICDQCGRMTFARCNTAASARDAFRVMGWQRDLTKNLDICPACQARVGNVQVIPEGETHAYRH